MKHQPTKKERDTTAADHRPMIPALRHPANPLDQAIRDIRLHDPLIEPKEFLNWR